MAKSTKAAKRDANIQTPPKKKLRIQPPDVVVSVGTGENKREYECYKVILSYACEYFDTMLSLPLREAQTSRINLPDKDPDEWEMFYEFIQPVSSQTKANITSENALILAPWFNEYQMEDLLEECDSIVSTREVFREFCKYDYEPVYMYRPPKEDNDSDAVSDNLPDVESESDYWGPKDILWEVLTEKLRSVETVQKVLEFYSICEKSSLQKSKQVALKEISRIMNHAYDVLATEPKLMEKVMEVYKNNIEEMESNLLDTNTNEFYAEIAAMEEVDWNSKLYVSWIRFKLENFFQKYQIKLLKRQTSFQRGEIKYLADRYYDQQHTIETLESKNADLHRKIFRLNTKIRTLETHSTVSYGDHRDNVSTSSLSI